MSPPGRPKGEYRSAQHEGCLMTNIVFDLGGVLLRWRPREVMRAAMPQRALSDAAADDIAHAIFQGFGGDWGEFDRGTVDPAELVARIARRTGLPAADVQAVVDVIPAELEPLADTVALLVALAVRGHPLYFLSNMPAPYAEHIEREHGFFSHFRSGVFSGRVGHIKPEPAIFELATQQFGARAQDCLFIDDVAHNIDAARALGWHGHHFQGAAAARLALQRLGLLEGAA